MAIKIGDNLYLGMLDEKNMCIYKEMLSTSKSTGKKVVVKNYLGYYPSLEYALKDMLKQKLMYTELTATMDKVLEEIENYKKLARTISKEAWRIYED